MNEIERKEAFEKAKEMFQKLDVDNEDHAAIILMLDKKERQFRMLTVNAGAATLLMMLESATDSVLECLEIEEDPNRTLN